MCCYIRAGKFSENQYLLQACVQASARCETWKGDMRRATMDMAQQAYGVLLGVLGFHTQSTFRSDGAWSQGAGRALPNVGDGP